MIFFANTYNSKAIIKKSRCLRIWYLCIMAVFFFSSCFTGIESTKKINLSRDDKKLTAPTPEEQFMSQLKTYPLKEWQQGKRFIVSDNRALLVIVPREGLISVPPDSIKGEILEFDGVESKINAAGDITLSIRFTDGIYVFSYDTGKNFDSAMEDVKSSQIPMLIDVDMVDDARNLLKGKKFCSMTNLWYDAEGNRINGKKYVEVTVADVAPGDMVFPLKLTITTDDGASAYLYMNAGNGDTESRSFHNLFSLSDIKKHYPSIEPETWNYISRGEVKVGMTKEECKLALGNPRDLLSGHDYSQTVDIWTFDNGKVLRFEDGRLVNQR